MENIRLEDYARYLNGLTTRVEHLEVEMKSTINVECCPGKYWAMRIYDCRGNLTYVKDWETVEELSSAVDMLTVGARLAQGKEV